MNLTAIKLTLFASLILIPLSSAVEFTFSYPAEVTLDEPFSVMINSDSQEPHDVKIFINRDVKTDSEIHDGEVWKSPHYYLIDVFPEKKEFLLVSHVLGVTNICARLRPTGGNNYEEKCGDIKITEGDPQQEEEQEESEEDESEEENNEEEQEIEEENQEAEDEEVEDETAEIEAPQQEQEKIYLNAPQETKIEDGGFYKTRKENTRISIVYGFTVLAVVVIVLLALRKL